MSRILLIAALGATVRVDLGGLSDDDADAVRNAWRGALVVERAQRPPVVERARIPLVVERAKRDETPPTVTPLSCVDQSTLLADLSQRVTLAAIGARRGEVWMLHAAGVALPDGRVVALVGPSGSGKTTASRVLAQTLGYVSDETVAIDDDGRVWPYRKPLSIIEGSGHKVQRAPSHLGLEELPDAALRLAAVVLLERREDGPDDPLVEPVELGDALEELVAQSSYLTDMPAPLQTMAALVASVGGVRRVVYREASTLTVAPLVYRSQDHSSAPSSRDGVSRRFHRSGPENGTGAGRDRPLWFRAPVHDELALDDPDRIAILQTDAVGQGTVRVLAGVAPALWRAADAASVDDLVAAAIDAYGEPHEADAEALVRTALADLAGAGLLEEDVV